MSGALETVQVSANADGAFELVQDGLSIGSIVVDKDPEQDINTMFILLTGAMVFFMHCGFAMLSVGAVRSKNAKNINLKILLDACFGALSFYLLGYGFAYGGQFKDPSAGGRFIGWQGFALNGVATSDWYNWFFQYAFAATSATIVSGAIAERCKFEAYVIYCSFLTAWVYPVVVHWVWSTTGWASPSLPDGDRLFKTGALDFAGDAAVHMIGGMTGLVGAFIIGPRIGRFGADGKAQPMPGHNASLAILGVFILWFGWYGFNPGSALAILGRSDVAAVAAVNTTLAAASGTVATLIVCMLIEYRASGHIVWDLIASSNGTLAGLVGITGSCAFVEPWAAIIIGATAGAVYVGASFLVLDVLHIDDPLDAGAVHCFCGAWGLLMAGLFAHKPFVAAAYGEGVASAGHGAFMSGGNGRILAANIVLILALTAWTLGHMVPFFLALNRLGLLRVNEQEEMAGLDISHHGGSAYNMGGKDDKGGLDGVQTAHAGSVHADYSKYCKGYDLSTDMLSRINALEGRNTELEKQLTGLRSTLIGVRPAAGEPVAAETVADKEK